MKDILVRSLMFISSYFPLYVFMLVKIYMNTETIFSTNLNNWYNYKLWVVVILCCFILTSFLSLVCFLKNNSINIKGIDNIERADDIVLNYIYTYMLPILSFELEKIDTLIINGLLFLLVWFLYIKLQLVYLNPLWAAFGYIPYPYKDGYILTNIEYEVLKRNQGVDIVGHYLTNGVFVANKKDNKFE